MVERRLGPAVVGDDHVAGRRLTRTIDSGKSPTWMLRPAGAIRHPFEQRDAAAAHAGPWLADGPAGPGSAETAIPSDAAIIMQGKKDETQTSHAVCIVSVAAHPRPDGDVTAMKRIEKPPAACRGDRSLVERSQPARRLARLFLKLRAIGFGGPSGRPSLDGTRGRVGDGWLTREGSSTWWAPRT